MDGGGEAATDRDRAWVWITLAALCVLVAPAAGLAASQTSGAETVTLVIVQCVCTAFAFLIPQARQLSAERLQATAEEREVDARTDTRLAMNDALEPVVTLLGNLALEPLHAEREQLKEKAVTLVLTTAAALIGPERSRACWFRLEGGPPKQLIPTEHVGRAGSASTTFVGGTPAGDAAISMVMSSVVRPVLVEDDSEGLEPDDRPVDPARLAGPLRSLGHVPPPLGWWLDRS